MSVYLGRRGRHHGYPKGVLVHRVSRMQDRQEGSRNAQVQRDAVAVQAGGLERLQESLQLLP